VTTPLKYLPDLKLAGSVNITRPVTYYFAFAEYGAWAAFTINDDTGEFNVQSDWGNWQHRWHVGSIGKRTFTQFLLTCDADYIVRKFAYENKADLKNVTDTDETLKAIRARICECRRRRDIRHVDSARELWDQAKAWTKDDCNEHTIPEELDKFLEQPWEYIRTMKSHRYYLLTERLLPFFFAWLKNHLTHGDAPTPAGTSADLPSVPS